MVASPHSRPHCVIAARQAQNIKEKLIEIAKFTVNKTIINCSRYWWHNCKIKWASTT